MADSVAFAQHHAWAFTELQRCVAESLESLQNTGDRQLLRLKHLLQAIIDIRDPSRCPEGNALRCLWSLPNTGNFKELEKRLRIIVVRRAQSMLYDYVSPWPQWSPDQCRNWFLQYCWQQLGQDEVVDSKTNMLFLAYHKEFGSSVYNCRFSLQSNLFPSASEWKATMWAQQNYNGTAAVRPAKPRAKKKGGSPQASSPAASQGGDASDDSDAAPDANPQEEGAKPNAWAFDEDEPSEDQDQAECESVDKYAFYEFRTNNSYSDVGDHGYQWWTHADQPQDADAGAGAQEDSEPDTNVAPFDTALCLVELTGVLAWIDEQAIYTTHSFCDVSGPDVEKIEHSTSYSKTHLETYRLHYRLKSFLSMLVTHPRCVLGVTCVNSRYKDIAASALRQLLKDCSGGDWTWHGDESPRYFQNEEAGKRVFVWTTDDNIKRHREQEGNHYFSKNCKKMWNDLAALDMGVDYKFGRLNTVCIDTKKQNFDAIDNVLVAPAWSNETWVRGIPEEPLVPLNDKSETHLERFLKDVFDKMDEVEDLRFSLQAC